jgi:hypothetical protein
MTTGELLKSIVERVEKSHLSQNKKEQVYVIMSQSLHAAVLPVLVKHMPKEKLENLSMKAEKVKVNEYYQLMNESLDGGATLLEMDNLMKEMLLSAEKELKNKFIIF